jgi:puromycin-sensitive aminopeptidase
MPEENSARTPEIEVLPTSVVPVRYDLDIKPNLDPACPYFTGEVLILVEVKERTSQIVLNAVDIDVVRVVIRQNGCDEEPEVIYDREHQRIVLTMRNGSLVTGGAGIRINYVGQINDRLVGFYGSRYQRPDGSNGFMALTQFEPGHARRAVPCFDEPAQKAEWFVNMTVPDGLTAISCGAVHADQPVADGRGLKTVYFQPTPKMSPYVLAFAVGELECVTARTKTGTRVSVWTTPGKREQGRFGLAEAVKALEHYEGLYGVPYPLPKLDLLAAPDFSFGAMENWGLLVHREVYLLVDDKTSESMKQYIAAVIWHETHHMWFGNLVTMKWWDDTWLNEGFTVLMEYAGLAAAHPEWKMWPQFVSGQVSTAMAFDGLAGSHPIVMPVRRVQDADEGFDAITYNKAAAVLRMLLRERLGVETFIEGMRRYLRDHAYGNATAAECCAAFEAVAPGRDVTRFMEAWTRQTGYPVVNVSLEPSPNGPVIATFRQSRFLASGADPADETVWPIPISYRVSDGGEGSFVLDGRQVEEVVGHSHPGYGRQGIHFWIQVNVGRTGFYRVNYDAEGWMDVADALQEGKVPCVEERFGFLDDATAFAAAGIVPVSVLTDLVDALRDETEYVVWAGIADGLSKIAGNISGSPELYGPFERFAASIYAPLADRVGWERLPSDILDDIRLRTLAMSGALRYGDEDMIADATAIIREMLGGGETDPDLRPVLYRVMANSEEVMFDRLLGLYRTSASPTDRAQILSALGSARDSEKLRRALEFAVSGEVRTQDLMYCFSAASVNPAGRRLVWDFVAQRWDDLAARHEGNPAAFARIVRFAGASLATREEAAEAQAFFDAHPVDGLDMTRRQAVEGILNRAAWLERNAETLADWLANWEATA